MKKIGVEFMVLIWLICGVSDSVDEGAGSRVILGDSNSRDGVYPLMREMKLEKNKIARPGFRHHENLQDWQSSLQVLRGV